jgi:hypothetical protein
LASLGTPQTEEEKTVNRRRKLWISVGVIVALVFLGSAVAGSVMLRVQGASTPNDDGLSESEVVGSAGMPERVQVLPDEAGPEMKASEEAQATAAPAGAVGSERLTIRAATIAVKVDDLEGAISKLRSTTAAAGGYVQDLSMGDPGEPRPLVAGEEPDGPRGATIVIRVPAENAANVVESASALGAVANQTENEQDVSYEAVDLDARLTNLRAEEARLRSFVEEAENVTEMLEVERELARVRGEIEATVAQLDYLERQAAMATVTVSLLQPGPVVRPAGVDWGLRDAVTRGVQTAAAVTSAAVSGFIAISPLVISALVVYALWRLVRRQRSRSVAQDPQPGL